MKQKHDIENMDDIRLMVDSFYQKVRKDDLIGHIFEEIIQDNWEIHLEKMYRFWQTILLAEPTYSGSPFLPHAHLPVNETHFKRWISLFVETVDEHFEGNNAHEAKTRAATTAAIFNSKIQYLQNKTI